MPATWTGWSEAEDVMLREHYPVRGPKWAGWAEVLPGRSYTAITTRAHKLGVKGPGKSLGRAGRSQLYAPGTVSTPYEYERCVRDCMADGMAPSQIDRKMHWAEGKAKEILMGTWDREGGR